MCGIAVVVGGDAHAAGALLARGGLLLDKALQISDWAFLFAGMAMLVIVVSVVMEMLVIVVMVVIVVLGIVVIVVDY